MARTDSGKPRAIAAAAAIAAGTKKALKAGRKSGLEYRRPCWPWPGRHRASDGRAFLGPRPAARVLYEAACGPVPPGMDLHHTCGNAWCVNPWHLEPLSRADHGKIPKRKK